MLPSTADRAEATSYDYVHEPAKPPDQSQTALIDDASTVLARHTPDYDAMCAECRALWGRLVPHPCTQVAWAQAVVARLPTRETMATLGLQPGPSH
jgi:hypothetical protein